MRTSILSVIGVLGLSLQCVSVGTAQVAKPRPIAFHWFEYCGTNAVEVNPGPGQYRNPILAGFYPDPSICRVGPDYYMVNSTFAYFPGIPIFHSRDLVNWEQLGHVIHRPEQLRYHGLGVSRAIFAPAISHHDGVFYVVCTMVDGLGNFVVTATNPAGPWSDPVQLPFEGIDPSIFFDDDGRAWIVNNGAPPGPQRYRGHRAIWIQEFDYKAKKMVGPRKLLVDGGVDITKQPAWIEGPHIYKRDGWYYLCCAEGGTGPGHSQVVFRSKNVDGPYTPWNKNPILTQRTLDPTTPGAVTCTGHADMEVGPDGNWWAVFLGVRPYQGRYSPMGRETFLLPVEWTDDGWPVILPPQARVPLVCNAPGAAEVKHSKSHPLNGNFIWRDEFDRPTLSPAWIMLRAPEETWWRVDIKAGKLNLTPRTERLSGRGNPSYLGRRVQHPRFSAATELDMPVEPGVSAGLAVFQGERFHYYAGVKRDTNGVVLFLERFRGGESGIHTTVQLPEAQTLRLRVVAHDDKCAFEYAPGTESWKTLATDLDATLLTTEVAGGFVGATVGMHARIETAPENP